MSLIKRIANLSLYIKWSVTYFKHLLLFAHKKQSPKEVLDLRKNHGIEFLSCFLYKGYLTKGKGTFLCVYFMFPASGVKRVELFDLEEKENKEYCQLIFFKALEGFKDTYENAVLDKEYFNEIQNTKN